MTQNVLPINKSLHDRAVDEFNRLHGTMIGEISAMLKTAKVAPLVDLRKKDLPFRTLSQNYGHSETYVMFCSHTFV